MRSRTATTVIVMIVPEERPEGGLESVSAWMLSVLSASVDVARLCEKRGVKSVLDVSVKVSRNEAVVGSVFVVGEDLVGVGSDELGFCGNTVFAVVAVDDDDVGVGIEVVVEKGFPLLNLIVSQ